MMEGYASISLFRKLLHSSHLVPEKILNIIINNMQLNVLLSIQTD